MRTKQKNIILTLGKEFFFVYYDIGESQDNLSLNKHLLTDCISHKNDEVENVFLTHFIIFLNYDQSFTSMKTFGKIFWFNFMISEIVS